MPVSFDTVAKEALDLTPRQRLKLAEVLLVSADGEPDSDCQELLDEFAFGMKAVERAGGRTGGRGKRG